jgi:serine protease
VLLGLGVLVFLSARFWSLCAASFTVLWASVAVYAQELPWHLGSLNSAVASAPAAINTAGSKPGPHDVVVAVIDGGILPSHPSLSGRLLPGYDMQAAPHNLKGGRSADFEPDPRDVKCSDHVATGSYRTHGTEVASLIAGNGRDGVTGVNPSAKILPVRLFGSCHMSRTDLLDALAWSAGMPVAGVPSNPNPARVVNLSFSGGKSVCGDDLQQMLDRMAKKNIFVVAAVGNTFGKRLAEPANCRGVISVGAVDAENNIEKYSALDSRTTIYAPGGGKRMAVDAPWQVNKLKVATFDLNFRGDEAPASLHAGVGTSYASPLVAGFVSLLLSHNPDMTPTEFIKQIPKYSRTVNPSSLCPECLPRGLAMNASLN